MGYMNDFERELRARIEAIEPGVEPDALVQWLKEQMLKSYRNGLAAQKTAKPGVEKKPRGFDRKSA